MEVTIYRRHSSGCEHEADRYSKNDLRKATGTLYEENLMNPTKDPWSGNQAPRLMFVTTGISHPWEMYGQMVIYLRMNGIDPYKDR